MVVSSPWWASYLNYSSILSCFYLSVKSIALMSQKARSSISSILNSWVGASGSLLSSMVSSLISSRPNCWINLSFLVGVFKRSFSSSIYSTFCLGPAATAVSTLSGNQKSIFLDSTFYYMSWWILSAALILDFVSLGLKMASRTDSLMLWSVFPLKLLNSFMFERSKMEGSYFLSSTLLVTIRTKACLRFWLRLVSRIWTSLITCLVLYTCLSCFSVISPNFKVFM